MTDTTLTILATTDLHGLYYGGHITPRPGAGNIARVREFVMHTRHARPDTIVLDAGDFMGGGIAAHWSNHVGLSSPHIPALMANGIPYDAMTPGNHDLDTGEAIVSRYAAELTAPLIACNVRGIPCLSPYTIIRRGDLRIAVIGVATTETPLFLHSGARFIPAVQAVRESISEINSLHRPDLTVGLFHIGPEESVAIARQSPGLDIIFCGHVHSDIGITRTGTTLIINPGPYGLRIARAEVTLGHPHPGIHADIIDLPDLLPDPMPEAIAAFGRQPVTSGPASLDTLVRTAHLHAYPEAQPEITPSGIMLPVPITMAETFRHLPYDDHILLLAPDETHPHPTSMTTYLHSSSGDSRLPAAIDPRPLRCHLCPKYYL